MKISAALRKPIVPARACGVVISTLLLAACGDTGVEALEGFVCDLDDGLLVSSLPPDAIPALTEPEMVPPDHGSAEYLIDADRVLGVVINGEARAYPHNILWHHEIVNDRIGNEVFSITFCPLTGSGLGFEREFGERVVDLGVSGLLFANNLILFDRKNSEIYGPQLGVEGRCEGFRGQALELVSVQEMSWGRWKELNPQTTVVGGDTGFNRAYRFYPYGDYDQLGSEELLFPMQVDRSRPIKERVLSIRVGDGGRGYPFGELGELGDVAAVNDLVSGIPTVVFYEARDGETALAFDARVGTQALTFDADPSGFWVDRETGSTWSVDGVATGGPLAGERLTSRSDAYTLFWFAWRHFQPEGVMFSS